MAALSRGQNGRKIFFPNRSCPWACPCHTLAQPLPSVTQLQTPTYILGVLPSRWGSTRFPGKPLHLIAGKPLIQHVWERCRQCSKLDEIIVATDDERIRDAVAAFGGKVAMTSPDHPTGTDRIAEAARAVPQATHIVNIQGDEPLIDPALIDELAAAMAADPSLDMATAANPLDPADPAVHDPNVVKVAIALDGRALYFSRSPLPFFRNPVAGLPVLRHKGIYAYKRDFLERFVTWPPSPLELAESLEQLRALENGASIRVLLTRDTSPGVDTLEQAFEIERLLTTSHPS
ncbi:3-deoxy-manno-octulosonate cytidylyltransferase [bacterium]|nr:3-deoxy-manno-octulosonate cytidylyltransferase [bacterium]